MEWFIQPASWQAQTWTRNSKLKVHQPPSFCLSPSRTWCLVVGSWYLSFSISHRGQSQCPSSSRNVAHCKEPKVTNGSNRDGSLDGAFLTLTTPRPEEEKPLHVPRRVTQSSKLYVKIYCTIHRKREFLLTCFIFFVAFSNGVPCCREAWMSSPRSQSAHLNQAETGKHKCPSTAFYLWKTMAMQRTYTAKLEMKQRPSI